MSEKVTVKVERNVLHLPAIALRGLVVFPNNLLHFEVGRDKSIAAVEWAVSNNSDVFLIAQKEMKVEDPNAADLCTYGVVAEIKQVMRVSDDLVRILVEGKYRAKLTQLDTDGSFLLSTVRSAPVKQAKTEEQPEVDVLVRNVKKSFDELLALNPHIGKDVVFTITTSTDPVFLSEYIPANLLFRFEDKQAILDEGTLLGRLKLLIEKMHRERRMLEIDKEIAQKVDEAMDKNQRDYYLHEQLHMISEELGEDDDTTAEAEEYRRKITALHLDEEREEAAVCYAWAAESKQQEDLVFTQTDIHEFIRTKAAAHTMVAYLIEEFGLHTDDIAHFYLAGAFGKYLDLESAITIGMYPDLPREKFVMLGNSSLDGAQKLLLDRHLVVRATELVKKITYVQFGNAGDFVEKMHAAQFLPYTDLDEYPSVKAKLARG